MSDSFEVILNENIELGKIVDKQKITINNLRKAIENLNSAYDDMHKKYFDIIKNQKKKLYKG